MVFLLFFTEEVNCNDLFSNVKSNLHFWKKIHFVIMCYPFNLVLDSML